MLVALCCQSTAVLYCFALLPWHERRLSTAQPLDSTWLLEWGDCTSDLVREPHTIVRSTASYSYRYEYCTRMYRHCCQRTVPYAVVAYEYSYRYEYCIAYSSSDIISPVHHPAYIIALHALLYAALLSHDHIIQCLSSRQAAADAVMTI